MRARTRVATAANEALLLEYAKLTTGSDLEKLCRKYAIVQQHGKAPHPLGDQQRRYVCRRDTEHGMIKIEAVLHPEEAEAVWRMLDHAATQLAGTPAAPARDDSAESCAMACGGRATAAAEQNRETMQTSVSRSPGTDVAPGAHASAESCAVAGGGCGDLAEYHAVNEAVGDIADSSVVNEAVDDLAESGAVGGPIGHSEELPARTVTRATMVPQQLGERANAAEASTKSYLEQLLDEADALSQDDSAESFAAESPGAATPAGAISALRQRAEMTDRQPTDEEPARRRRGAP